MYPTRELLPASAPAPDAYDGFWLEALENPDAALPADGAPGTTEGRAFEVPPGDGAPGV
jgi:hypothetical protein